MFWTPEILMAKWAFVKKKKNQLDQKCADEIYENV